KVSAFAAIDRCVGRADRRFDGEGIWRRRGGATGGEAVDEQVVGAGLGGGGGQGNADLAGEGVDFNRVKAVGREPNVNELGVDVLERIIVCSGLAVVVHDVAVGVVDPEDRVDRLRIASERGRIDLDAQEFVRLALE